MIFNYIRASTNLLQYEKKNKMRGHPLIIAFIVVFNNEVTHGHPFHTRSRSIQNPLFRDSCSYTCNNLASLLALSRTLEEKEEPVKEIVTAPALFNADELIMKLVNALVYATTQRAENHCHCHCPHPVKSSASDDSHNNGGGIRSSSSNNGHSNGGLLNLDLLNSNKRDNLLDIDLSNQHLVGVGLGGKNQGASSHASSSAYSNTYSHEPAVSTSRASSTSNSEGLINVALLDSKNHHNVAAVNLGKQNVVGVGLLDETKGNRKHGHTSEGLVNLDVLNPNKENNVAELALGQQKVLGVGIGGSNNDYD